MTKACHHFSYGHLQLSFLLRKAGPGWEQEQSNPFLTPTTDSSVFYDYVRQVDLAHFEILVLPCSASRCFFRGVAS